MNILFLALDIELERQRGDAIHVCELARALAARGHRIDLITATPRGSLPNLGPDVHCHSRPKAGDFGVVRACVKIARRSQADIVYERRLSPKIAFGVSRLVGIPFVVEVNGIEEEAALQGRPLSSPWRPVKSKLRREMFRKAAGVVAVSEGLASYVVARANVGRDRVAVVPNGVNPDRFSPLIQAEAQSKVGFPPAQWILYVGNLVPWQGIETVIQSMGGILERVPDARFAIVGDGMLRGALQRMVETLDLAQSVRFVGSVPHEEVPTYIGCATACVAPFTRTRNELIGLSPLKMYEYMACARPFVTSAVPGITQLTERSGGGLAVTPDDPEAFATALASVLTNPAEARAMGERGRRFALAECTWQETAARIERVLERAHREA